MQNLDFYCMKYGQQIAEKKTAEQNLRKALGVLQEDGVYSMFLFLEKQEDAIRKDGLIHLLNDETIKKSLGRDSAFPEDFLGFCQELQQIASNLSRLLFTKKLMERTLIYALYHTKAKEAYQQ